MKGPLGWARWSPYAVGGGIGVLSWATFLFMDKALGASTSFVNAAGVPVAALAPEHARANAYWAKHVIESPPFDWQVALVLMMAVGAFVAARFAGSRRREHVPSVWASSFGPSRWKRYVGAFYGGAILLFGARLAGGCTSGHGVSGGLQLAVSSYVFVAAMFVAGTLTAMAIYNRRTSHV